MNDLSHETIVAVATPPGRGGIGIVRLSGPQAKTISGHFIQGDFPQPRVAAYKDFLSAEGEVLDQGILLYFPNPHSFTGEDVVEFQGHGSPAVLNALVMSAVQQGARLAKPGEFSERAFLNNRIDLAQAEAIADLIHASSEKAARFAMRSLEGVFSEKVDGIHQALIQLRTTIEAAIDFSEEAIETLADREVITPLKQIVDALKVLQSEAKNGQRLQEGMQLIIAGPPNAGKSSLLNRLSEEEKAIVSETAGTTRDIIAADIVIDGLPVHVLDTAGLRLTEDTIEKEGIRRALKAIEKADQILWVVDSALPESEIGPKKLLALLGASKVQAKILVVRNKIDLTKEVTSVVLGEDYDTIRLSVATGDGVDTLKSYLKQQVGYESETVGFSARQRHITALARSEKLLLEGLNAFESTQDLEIIAMHLKEAHEAVGEITGRFTTEDLLGRIFSTFCIGK